MIERRDIKGYEGQYQISNTGLVKSVITNREIRSYKNCKSGYMYVKIGSKGNKRHTTIHSLIAESFLGHVHKKGFVVDHIDNNRSNNSLNNLQIITIRENCSKDKKNKTSKYTGVIFHLNRWEVSIRDADNNKKYIGRFTDEYEAHKAYQDALKKINENYE